MKFKGSIISKKDDEGMLPKAFIQSEKDLNRDCLITWWGHYLSKKIK